MQKLKTREYPEIRRWREPENRGKGARQFSQLGKTVTSVGRGSLGLSKALHSFYLDCRIIHLSLENVTVYSRGTKKAWFCFWSPQMPGSRGKDLGGEKSQGFSQSFALLSTRYPCACHLQWKQTPCPGYCSDTVFMNL